MSDLSSLPGPAEPATACPCVPGAAEPDGDSGRFGSTHALILLIAVLGLGSTLFLVGTPLETVFALLGGCGAIGAATLAAARGGRRLVTVIVETAVRSSTAAGK
ncbi:hypothetical protein [Streptomyces sp. NBC_01716]|uniref:hypothetical protein n=1 Tax=Streptomyces sp. NBC_01716 TaxID=2975917 RepID=UPI002E3190E0|nr:hypothetical protein [Streptomyces sp. NBC_01716]